MSHEEYSMPKVSVIIPVYNGAAYVGETIESVLAQTWCDWELIVVDDGSTDDTPAVVAKFGNVLRYIRQENRGPAAARNTGIQAAQGEFIALLDADDLWQPDFLATLVPALESDPSLAGVYSGTQFVDANGLPLPQASIKVVPAEQLYDALVDGGFFAADSVLIRKTCFDHLGLFDEQLQACEDWDMWLRISREFRFVGVPQPLVKYRRREDNMSADLQRMYQNRLAVVRKHFGPDTDDVEQWPLVRRRAYAGVYLSTALAYFQGDDLAEGRDCLRRAFETYPDLTKRVDVFYELGCADQILGQRGDFQNLNLDRNAHNLLASLDLIFSSTRVSPALDARRSIAYGNAYFALGLLNYGCQRMGEARRYLLLALRAYPPHYLNRQLVFTLAKSLLGARLVSALSHRRSRS